MNKICNTLFLNVTTLRYQKNMYLIFEQLWDKNVAVFLFDVTEQGYSTHDPVVWRQDGG